MYCNRCKKLALEKGVPVGFRAECAHCGADLHTCTNCRFYSPGKPNDCSFPGTDYVRDREKNNFCEEFKPKEEINNKPSKKNSFNSLFKDP